jgi:hypothetical protein
MFIAGADFVVIVIVIVGFLFGCWSCARTRGLACALAATAFFVGMKLLLLSETPAPPMHSSGKKQLSRLRVT